MASASPLPSKRVRFGDGLATVTRDGNVISAHYNGMPIFQRVFAGPRPAKDYMADIQAIDMTDPRAKEVAKRFGINFGAPAAGYANPALALTG